MTRAVTATIMVTVTMIMITTTMAMALTIIMPPATSMDRTAATIMATTRTMTMPITTTVMPPTASRSRLARPPMSTDRAAAMITTMAMRTTTRTIPTPAMPMATGTSMAETAHLPLMAWLSPAFPVGAFAYSHGLEWAVETGAISGAASLAAWIDDLLGQGSGRSDAVVLAAAWRAITEQDSAALAEVAELAVALQPSGERHLEATQQGGAFVAAARAAWPTPAFDTLAAAWNGPVAYPVAVGVASAGHGIALQPTLEAFLLAFVANLVSAAVRLGAIGQTDGQRVTAGAVPAVRAAAAFAAGSSIEDVGGAAFRSDIASLRHETQYTRLFRS